MYSNHKAPRKVSRRVVLGTAGAGALGAAAAGVVAWQIGGSDAGSNSASADAITTGELSAANAMISADTENNPIVAFLENPNGDKVLFFRGTESVEVQDATLVNALKNAAGR
jgi:hypothetical protein